MGDFMGNRRLVPTIAAAFIYAFFASSLYASAARAGVKATRLYVPVGYDSNDEIVAVVEGYLENTCEQLRGAKVTPVGTDFLIEPQSEKHGTKCDPLLTPYTLEVVINPEESLDQGRYTVRVQGRSKMLTEPLVVKVASGQWPDEHIYAPVDDAEVGLLSGGRMRAVIQGRFQNTCVVIDEMVLDTKNGKTYELRPKTKWLTADEKGAPCAYKETRFTAKVDFDEPAPGRYLLHVRSQSGRSVNRVFSNVW
jgi:hypothetical protein